LAGTVFLIEPVQIRTGNLKGGNPSHRVLDPDALQAPALAQKKRPDENVRGLIVLDNDHLY